VSGRQKKIAVDTALAETYDIPAGFYYTAYRMLAADIEADPKYKYTAVVMFHYLGQQEGYSYNTSSSRIRDIMAGNNESLACDAGDWVLRLKKEGKLNTEKIPI